MAASRAALPCSITDSKCDMEEAPRKRKAQERAAIEDTNSTSVGRTCSVDRSPAKREVRLSGISVDNVSIPTAMSAAEKMPSLLVRWDRPTAITVSL